jgi:glyoxylase-like metal-dependent hydrolase (beta-lactamase superfamily II)
MTDQAVTPGRRPSTPSDRPRGGGKFVYDGRTRYLVPMHNNRFAGAGNRGARGRLTTGDSTSKHFTKGTEQETMGGELPPGIRRIDCGRVNAYLVEDEEALTLVDGGMPGCADAIRTAVREEGHAIRDLDRVLLTHYDVDHVGALAKLTPALDAQLVASRHAATMLMEDQAPPLTNHKGLIQRVSGVLISTPDLPVTHVEDRASVGSFTAYHTPGHTPGHVVYVSERLDVAFLGDLVYESDGDLESSKWRVSYDTETVRSSITSLAEEGSFFEYACPGHGEPLGDGFGRLERLADRLEGED